MGVASKRAEAVGTVPLWFTFQAQVSRGADASVRSEHFRLGNGKWVKDGSESYLTRPLA